MPIVICSKMHDLPSFGVQCSCQQTLELSKGTISPPTSAIAMCYGFEGQPHGRFSTACIPLGILELVNCFPFFAMERALSGSVQFVTFNGPHGGVTSLGPDGAAKNPAC